MTLAQLLRQRRHVMLDFDGPICAVFGGIPAHHVNRHYAAILRSHDIPVSDDLADGDDPLGIFRAAATQRPDQAVFIEHTLRDLEVHAIATAPLMPGASETLLSLRDTGRTATIVSNNSTTAIRAFLTRHRLNDLVQRRISPSGVSCGPEELGVVGPAEGFGGAVVGLDERGDLLDQVVAGGEVAAA